MSIAQLAWQYFNPGHMIQPEIVYDSLDHLTVFQPPRSASGRYDPEPIWRGATSQWDVIGYDTHGYPQYRNGKTGDLACFRSLLGPSNEPLPTLASLLNPQQQFSQVDPVQQQVNQSLTFLRNQNGSLYAIFLAMKNCIDNGNGQAVIGLCNNTVAGILKPCLDHLLILSSLRPACGDQIRSEIAWPWQEMDAVWTALQNAGPLPTDIVTFLSCLREIAAHLGVNTDPGVNRPTVDPATVDPPTVKPPTVEPLTESPTPKPNIATAQPTAGTFGKPSSSQQSTTPSSPSGPSVVPTNRPNNQFVAPLGGFVTGKRPGTFGVSTPSTQQSAPSKSISTSSTPAINKPSNQLSAPIGGFMPSKAPGTFGTSSSTAKRALDEVKKAGRC